MNPCQSLNDLKFKKNRNWLITLRKYSFKGVDFVYTPHLNRNTWKYMYLQLTYTGLKMAKIVLTDVDLDWFLHLYQ